eukprot:CAMPEP_0197179936 /NCGR_PEP_ID=MMETSP1423-20130617/4731_1 /TAXON_ID=476441 /ORGANISM="Pseudo-nitzschia heimii, Strain UNC1101" /LENGTH=506 /DNA_ID=CAMNT_0042629941 /DNA_START=201 /DNA_END=1722 /DNA_ORIENTATION=-
MSRSSGDDGGNPTPTGSGVSRDRDETRGDDRPNPDPGLGLFLETVTVQRTRDLLEGFASRAFRRTERVFERHGGGGDRTSTSTSTSTGAATSGGDEANQRRSQRRRRRSRDPSNESEESAARRRRRASNVVESLRELLQVPTSSTLGDSAEETSPRSDAGDGTAGGNDNENGNQAEAEGNTTGAGAVDRRRPTLQFGIANMLRDDSDHEEEGNEDGNENDDEDDDDDDEDEDEDDESDDGSIQIIDTRSFSDLGFEIDGLIDRDQILNNLMESSVSMLRNMAGAGAGAPVKTDLKCPVCSEVFVDYEASDHPNASGGRSSTTTRCSHGAMSLFTKLYHCPICFEEDIEPPNVIALACGHVVCKQDFCKLGGHVGPDRPSRHPKPKPVVRSASLETSPTSPGGNVDTGRSAFRTTQRRNRRSRRRSREITGSVRSTGATAAAVRTERATDAGSGPSAWEEEPLGTSGLRWKSSEISKPPARFPPLSHLRIQPSHRDIASRAGATANP